MVIDNPDGALAIPVNGLIRRGHLDHSLEWQQDTWSTLSGFSVGNDRKLRGLEELKPVWYMTLIVFT